MDDDDCSWYQCKDCQTRLKTTAELRKHIRLNHRKPKEKCLSPLENNEASHQSKPDGRTGSINKSGDYLTCKSCSNHRVHHMSSSLLLLLTRNKSANGAFKCPYCVTVQLEKLDLLTDRVEPTSGRMTTIKSDVSEGKTDGEPRIARNSDVLPNPTKSETQVIYARKSIITTNQTEPEAKKTFSRQQNAFAEEEDKEQEFRRSPVRNLSMRRRSRSTSNGRVQVKTHPTRRMQDRRKRKLISGTIESPAVSRYSHQSTLPASTSPASPFSPSTFTTTPPALNPTHTSERKEYELLYKRTNKGGTDSGNRRSSKDHEPPLKVSVLINNNPYPTSSRLAVPKAKHYQKGNIRCQYCGFQAKSFREIQFHVNTHLSKAYPCEFCPAIYRSKQGVTKHTVKHHPGKVSTLNGMESSGGNSDYIDEEQSNHSSSMASEADRKDEELSLACSDSNSLMMMDEDSSSYVTAPSNFPTDENWKVSYDHDCYSTVAQPSVAYGQFSSFGVGESLEKVVDLANF